jgi:hypothetical protein
VWLRLSRYGDAIWTRRFRAWKSVQFVTLCYTWLLRHYRKCNVAHVRTSFTASVCVSGSPKAQVLHVRCAAVLSSSSRAEIVNKMYSHAFECPLKDLSSDGRTNRFYSQQCSATQIFLSKQNLLFGILFGEARVRVAADNALSKFSSHASLPRQ